MLVADMMRPDGRVFLKSEWGQIGDDWPCVSFTKASVFRQLRADFRPGRDVLLYVGTTGDETRDVDHRSRIISAVVVQPNQMLETRKIVPPDSYARAFEQYGDRWPLAVAVLTAANVDGPPFPSARDLAPTAYRSLGLANRGQIAEAFGEEREAFLSIGITPFDLQLAPEVAAYVRFSRTAGHQVPKSINAEATRMADLIIERVRRGGELITGMNPIRTAPAYSELYALLVRKWQDEQRETCALCGGQLVSNTTNAMLKASADRIDSANPAYDEANVQITHLACNWAKNQYGVVQFEEWVAAVRGVVGVEAALPIPATPADGPADLMA